MNTAGDFCELVVSGVRIVMAIRGRHKKTERFRSLFRSVEIIFGIGDFRA